MFGNVCKSTAVHIQFSAWAFDSSADLLWLFELSLVRCAAELQLLIHQATAHTAKFSHCLSFSYYHQIDVNCPSFTQFTQSLTNPSSRPRCVQEQDFSPTRLCNRHVNAFSLWVAVLILWTTVFIVHSLISNGDTVSWKMRGCVCAGRRIWHICSIKAQNKKSIVPLTHRKRSLKGQEGWISTGWHAFYGTFWSLFKARCPCGLYKGNEHVLHMFRR